MRMTKSIVSEFYRLTKFFKSSFVRMCMVSLHSMLDNSVGMVLTLQINLIRALQLIGEKANTLITREKVK